jgi:hypothetical protein
MRNQMTNKRKVFSEIIKENVNNNLNLKKISAV